MILAFYDEKLTAAGWTIDPPTAGGRTFSYRRGGPEDMTGSAGKLRVQPMANGMVEVQLTIGGTEVR